MQDLILQKINVMNVIDALKWRYATKKFDASRTLSEDKIDLLKEAFNLTATSFGLQTIKMVVVSDRELREELVKHSYNQRQVADASHLFVICIQEDIDAKDVDSFFDTVSDIRETPKAILDPFRNDLKNMMRGKTKEERQSWSTNQAYIALGNLMTVCAIERIDACPMEGFVGKDYDEILELSNHNLKSVLLLPVGYRAQDDKFSDFKKVRKPLENSTLVL